jgi:hypothetical protein
MKMKALEGHQQRKDAWVEKRTALGYPETAFYYHWLTEHAAEEFEYWGKDFTGFAITSVNCEAKEHGNKKIKQEILPLMGLLRQGVKNAFNHVMQNWLVRLLHFPETIPVRRVEKCGACGTLGHRCSSRLCPEYDSYVEMRRVLNVPMVI